MELTRTTGRVAAAVLLSALTLCAQADDRARTWLENMGQAVEQLNYRGTFVHTLHNQMETMEVLHKTENGRVYERMTSQSGAAREFLRQGEEIQCILDARKEVMVDLWSDKNPLMSSLPRYTDKLNKYYEFEIIEEAKLVAGRETIGLAIIPRDEYRYGYRLWVDRETAMPLLCDSVDRDGQLIETLQFTAIEYNPKFSPTAFDSTLNTQDFNWIKPSKESSPERLSNTTWHAADMPSGFSLSVSSVEDNGETRVEHHVYSDGLATVSVFAEQREPGQAVMRGAARMGVTNAFGRLEGDVQITVVGEVPPTTVKFIGNSFQPVK
ncbi:MAG: MucB/RseB C-terminal domain-containing protein [Gammaproteobacteria bacterium]